MAKNSKSGAAAPAAKTRMTTAQIARIVLGVLLAINLIGVWLMVYPPGGSAEALDQELIALQKRLKDSRVELEGSKQRRTAITQGGGASDEFLTHYFLTRRTVNSTMLRELGQIGQRAGIKGRGTGFAPELIDGSETLGVVSISAAFEGTYRNLLSFVREIDRSDSLLTIESLGVLPLQNGNQLSVTMKLLAFTKDLPGEPLEQVIAETAPQEAAR
jgi:hypothetical protein